MRLDTRTTLDEIRQNTKNVNLMEVQNVENFMNKLEDTIGEEGNVSITENGAVGYKTSGKSLLDLNFAITSLRGKSDDDVKNMFERAFIDDKKLAIKWLFYAGDVRFGVGERRLFRVGLEYLAEFEPELLKKVLKFVPEYTRWDNYLHLLDTVVKDDVVAIIREQLNRDVLDMKEGKSISLASKWLPSANSSSATTKRYAKMLIKALGYSERAYRKLLSSLRSYSNVVEVKMSSKRWGDIDYASVPSRANLIYKEAFLRNDKERRQAYLDALTKGETKINAGVVFPHDIVHKYIAVQSYSYKQAVKPEDTVLEEMWKALPDYVKGNGTTICVADGSGSMTTKVGNSGVNCLEVANALAIYFAERCKGAFYNKYITFSENPQLVNLGFGETLRDKIRIALQHDEYANTNIEGVFDLILATAVKHKMKQDDLPSTILVLSDMEFDSATYCYGHEPLGTKLFATIADKFEERGYKLPRLVFWNINSRTGTIPVKQNDLGVALVSGFSPAVVSMVLSNEVDPFKCLLEQINSKRYEPIEEALSSGSI